MAAFDISGLAVANEVYGSPPMYGVTVGYNFMKDRG